MNLRPFALERFFARYEFSTRYLLCASDPESLALDDLLGFEPAAREQFGRLWLGYTQSRGGDDLRRAIARFYEHADPENVLVHGGSEEPILAFMSAVLQPGDHVVVQSPSYQSQYSVAEAIGASVTR